MHPHLVSSGTPWHPLPTCCTPPRRRCCRRAVLLLVCHVEGREGWDFCFSLCEIWEHLVRNLISYRPNNIGGRDGARVHRASAALQVPFITASQLCVVVHAEGKWV